MEEIYTHLSNELTVLATFSSVGGCWKITYQHQVGLVSKLMADTRNWGAAKLLHSKKLDKMKAQLPPSPNTVDKTPQDGEKARKNTEVNVRVDIVDNSERMQNRCDIEG